MSEDQLKFLEEERKKIWSKITILENLLNKKTSDYENEAKVSCEQSLEFKRESEEAKNSIINNLEEANMKLADLKKIYNSFDTLNTEVQDFSKKSKEQSDYIKITYDQIKNQSETIQNNISEIERIIEQKPILDEKLIKLEDIFTKGDNNNTKLNTLFKSITERKKEIDDLYYQIIGYSETNDEGVETKVTGLKDELENSYTLTKSKLEVLNKNLEELKSQTKIDYDGFAQEKESIFSSTLKLWEEKYSKIEKTISDLMPRALTAGLSYAYSEKKINEEKEYEKVSRTFNNAILGLIAISLIPFFISIHSIFKETDLETIIYRIPKLVLAILPLYIPVLWVAYSANKKMNLSKRLIEEYSHKEVLSKTFEGLSKQINNVEDKDISFDLRIKLLYNILEVNSENPGKLISDYNKSDHPLMDALDKSVKLSNAVTKLSKIPGFSKLAASLEKKSNEILKEEERKANAALESLEVDKTTSNGNRK